MTEILEITDENFEEQVLKSDMTTLVEFHRLIVPFCRLTVYLKISPFGPYRLVPEGTPSIVYCQSPVKASKAYQISGVGGPKKPAPPVVTHKYA